MQVLFRWIFFLLAEKDQERATSSRVRCSRATGLCMYANIKVGIGGMLLVPLQTCWNTLWLTFNEKNRRLQRTSGSFCSMWHVSCALMSHSATVCARNCLIGWRMGSSLGATCVRWERIAWYISYFGSSFDAYYFEMYLRTACLERTGRQSTLSLHIESMVGLWIFRRESFLAGL